MVAGKLSHSKKRGDGYGDTESKFLMLLAAITAALKAEPCDLGPAPLGRRLIGWTEWPVFSWCSAAAQQMDALVFACVCPGTSHCTLALARHPPSPCLHSHVSLSPLCCLGGSAPGFFPKEEARGGSSAWVSGFSLVCNIHGSINIEWIFKI